MAYKTFRWYLQVGLFIIIATNLVLANGSSDGLQHILHPQEASPEIITGQYDPARISIHNTTGHVTWNWTKVDFVNQDIPKKLNECLQNGGSVTDVKWANHGRSVVAVFANAVVIINHCPDEPSKDKAITFGMCLDKFGLGGTHGIELLPDGKLAIATTSYEATGNIKIVNTSLGASNPYSGFLQELDGLPAVHSLVWDQVTQSLWAVGNDLPPKGKCPSTAQLNRYEYRNGSFSQKPSQIEPIGPPRMLSEEWDDSWWDGGHDITPVPDHRHLLISTDPDLHLFNLTSASFLHGEEVLKQPFMQGFKPVYSHEKHLPRADVKSLSLRTGSGTLYVQADWKGYFSTQVNYLTPGAKAPRAISFLQSVYRSRRFSPVAGWSIE
ncbi:hypothetical protein ACKRZS_011674 [Fusarium odoratissimum]|uniref:Uncharacterized protein n=3 Tax=Fusarium oxysporum species complex TaxID=171631 RepID=N1SAI6_FUSC4|nr:uncharacterized protein FOIG_14633 [Fusarium odoratissimum NRRL 54006]EMT74247.1 hypothetical protein FOC4_g10002728 [Fusarium odoratissimum]EXL92189.1 hypothetical protein FOIG_14633 [Fusarium odoratissimum NRRL 54006]KAK2124596.1 hypothetical protein NOF04DRAFT_16074 [Fusarium oxysporum II5]TXC02965.1 hypothetical protein FocTR4_00014965 [Fusarium oxysporum f. sp. cubense]